METTGSADSGLLSVALSDTLVTRGMGTANLFESVTSIIPAGDVPETAPCRARRVPEESRCQSFRWRE